MDLIYLIVAVLLWLMVYGLVQGCKHLQDKRGQT